MARSDLLVSLVKAAVKQNKNAAVRVTEEIIAEEYSKNHRVLSKRLSDILKNSDMLPFEKSIVDSENANLLTEIQPDLHFRDLCISKINRDILEDFKEEIFRRELLQSYGLEPRNRLMLIGEPGNGKTSLAESIATELMLPLVLVNYESLIGSLLGETSNRLKKVFDVVRQKPCVLFFDEFDVISKKRGDIHETGEIKRTVNALLLQLDKLPSRTIVIVASNHPELIDPAAWRRFQIRLQLDPPGLLEVKKYLEHYERNTGLDFGISLNELSKKIKPGSFADLEEFCRSVLRKAILTRTIKDAKPITMRKIDELKQKEQLVSSMQ